MPRPDYVIYRRNGSAQVPMNSRNSSYFLYHSRRTRKRLQRKRFLKRLHSIDYRFIRESPSNPENFPIPLYNSRLVMNDIPTGFKTPEKVKSKNYASQIMKRFRSDPTQVGSMALLSKHTLPDNSHVAGWVKNKFTIPNFPNNVERFNDRIPPKDRNYADHIILQAAKGSPSYKAPALKKAFLDCTRDPKTGIPYVLKGFLTDGANFIGRGQYGLNIAPNGVNEAGHYHDYLYSEIGKLDPVMKSYDQTHPDFAFLSRSYSSGHPIWGVVAYVGLKLAEASDAILPTSFVKGRNVELSPEMQTLSRYIRALSINPAAGTNSNTSTTNTSNSNFDLMRQVISQSNNADSEDIISNMIMPPAAAAGGFVVPHVVLQPYTTDYDAIRVLEAKFEPVKTAAYCQRIFKGDEDYVLRMVKSYPQII